MEVAAFGIFSLGWVALVVVAAREHYVPDVEAPIVGLLAATIHLGAAPPAQVAQFVGR